MRRKHFDRERPANRYWQRTGARAGRVWFAGLAVCLAMGLALSLATGPSAAQPTDQAKITLTDARKALADGKAAVAAGQNAAAIGQLTTAIDSKRLSRRELAAALYHRGHALKGAGEFARAISDFTAALWMKPGLSADEHKQAMATRADTYRLAGLSGQGQAGTSDVAGGAELAQSASPADTGAVVSSGSARPSGGGSVAWQTTTQSAEDAKAAQDPISAAGRSITNFFGSVFAVGSTRNGSNAGGPLGTSGSAAGTIGPGAETPGAVSAWTQSTSTALTSGAIETGAVTPSSKAPGSAASGASGLRVQVAALRNPNEARALADQLNRRFSGNGGGEARIVETTLGNMGRFYAVQLGPFASQRETQPVCAQLKRDGHDCMIVR